ncbi:MAG: DNA integrity scanning protein DisA nucleotide-binding domain protein, partial [Clostridia bacterium]|nr:DNA integrity scanning protein DisA nucleotide-binding domain protein [Clostridia bacterium]
RGGRLHAAGCVLPLSVNPDIVRDLGTRHRAAIGMSENSDAVVVVVSEETGTISLAVEGTLTYGYSGASLRRKLESYLIAGSDSETGGGLIGRIRAKFAKKDETDDNISSGRESE